MEESKSTWLSGFRGDETAFMDAAMAGVQNGKQAAMACNKVCSLWNGTANALNWNVARRVLFGNGPGCGRDLSQERDTASPAGCLQLQLDATPFPCVLFSKEERAAQFSALVSCPASPSDP
jgi:hypothetical protein